MNDASGENVEEHVNEADQLAGQQTDRQGQKSSPIQTDESHLVSTRWWFASSAFPLIAGTLGPTASAFSICALVRPWRQRLEPGGDITEAEFIKDPKWLTIVNAIQLVVAIVSNVFLLLNMTRRVRFTIAQPITIVGWYISAICLLALNAAAAGPLLRGFDFPESELVWSQAFYYGIWAAILYFLDSSLMVVTFWGAKSGRYSKDFNLSTSQRTLMLQTIAFLVYLLVGALVFSTIEGWNYLDTVYWADVTLFTVGFGDITPTSSLAQALVMPYSLVGIITLGLVIGSIRSMILERGKRRMDSRMEEKKRHKVVKTMIRRGTDSILRPMPSSEEATPDSGSPTEEKKKKSLKRAPTNEFERRQQEFDLMRKIQRKATLRRRWVDLGISSSCWLVLWLIGAYIFYESEKPYQGWTYFEAVYFCYVSLVTIGYGDKSPVSNAGRSFFVFWSLLALPTMTVLISNAGDTVVKFVKDATLRLGEVTILPGEKGFVDDVKHIIYKASGGRLFPDHPKRPEVRVPRRSLVVDLENASDDSTADFTNEHQDRGRPSSRPDGLDRNASTFTAAARRSLSRLRNPHVDLPTGSDFQYLLACEIQAVSQHLHEGNPRHYSFEEWAWYLKLIGEDERSPETHRGPIPREVRLDPGPDSKRKRKRRRKMERESNKDGPVQNADDFEQEHKWSWVGTRNPLMGSKEESEWILERLTERLKEAISETWKAR